VSPYLNEAMAYEKEGKYKEALPAYREILKRDPDNPVALNNVAYMMAETGSGLDEALSLANRALQKVPNNLDIADTVGWIYIKKNLSDNAIQIFKDLTQKNPEKSTYHYHLGMALFQKGDRPGAKRSLETALSKRPDKDEESKIKELIAKCG
jgi:tetratricopeptide (TPR) repeat protein